MTNEERARQIKRKENELKALLKKIEKDTNLAVFLQKAIVSLQADQIKDSECI